MRPSPSALAVVLIVALGPLSAVGAQEASRDCPICAEAAAHVERMGLRAEPTPVRERPGWAPPRKIVTTRPDLVPLLRQAAPDAEIVTPESVEEFLEAVRDADILISGCYAPGLNAGTVLKWVQIISAGVGSCARATEFVDRDVLVTNMQRVYGPGIGDHVMAMLLAHARGLDRYARDQAEQRWSHGFNDALAAGLYEVTGKTMLVVGLGGVGTEIAQRASAMGMTVLATRNSRREGPDFVEYVGLAHEMAELAERADVVVNATPLTDDTRGMFDAAFFARMKPTAYFVNVGRGESVVTDDLVAALREGAIAGAGLDVTDPEPLPRGHPLWSLPTVTLTPHVAFSTEQLVARVSLTVFENLRRYVAGEPMLSVVDLSRGY